MKPIVVVASILAACSENRVPDQVDAATADLMGPAADGDSPRDVATA